MAKCGFIFGSICLGIVLITGKNYWYFLIKKNNFKINILFLILPKKINVGIVLFSCSFSVLEIENYGLVYNNNNKQIE
jgi:hypothetical protein